MIEVRNLTKKYGKNTAVSDLNFFIEKGKIYGLLGANGAGKTTTMNMITGCLAKTSGEIFINGMDSFEHPTEVKKLIGYLPEQPPLYRDMTVREYLTFIAKAKRVERKKIHGDIATVMQKTHISDVADRLIKNLSKGYKQRVGIAQAILGNPQIIILDEPTVGLDPKQIIEIRDLIKSLGGEHTVILSSHILSEIQSICDNIIIISQGKLVADDTAENLERRLNGGKGCSTLKITAKASRKDINQALKGIKAIREIEFLQENGGTVTAEIKFDGDKSIEEDVFSAFCNINKPILRMDTVHASLEDVFMTLTEADKDENSDGKRTVAASNRTSDEDNEEEER